MSLSGRDLDELFTRFMGTMPIRRVDFGIDTKSSMRRGGIFSEFDKMQQATERMVEEAVYDMQRLPTNLIIPNAGKRNSTRNRTHCMWMRRYLGT